MGITLRTEFKSTILSLKLMYLCPHIFNFSLKFSINGSHVDVLFTFASTGRLEYLNGTLPLLQFKKLHTISMKPLSTLTPIKELLKKLFFKPDTISKSLRRDFIAQRFSTVGLPIQSVSSTYCK